VRSRLTTTGWSILGARWAAKEPNVIHVYTIKEYRRFYEWPSNNTRVSCTAQPKKRAVILWGNGSQI
jgi:hypothetical protein